MMKIKELARKKNNFVLIGEAGCGKSEIAINIAKYLVELGDKPVHFFDLDMTKPLFRSRDMASEIEKWGVHVHFEEQFMDAPTVAGGVMHSLMDDDCYTVMDVGGDYIGARSIGGYSMPLNQDDSAIFYVINSFRPWSLDMEHINQVLGQVLGVSHIRFMQVKLIANPNLGIGTTAKDIEYGVQKLLDAIGNNAEVEFVCIWKKLLAGFQLSLPLLPIDLYLTYSWECMDQEPV